MKHIFTVLLGLGMTAIPASAELNITLTPGSLADRFADLANTTETTLVLTGEANEADLDLLKGMSDRITTLDMSGLKVYELPAYLFTGSNLTSIKLPESLRKIGDSAFVGSQLESIEFPTSLTEIGNYAFANVDKLSTVTFKNSVKLGVGVFKDCDLLQDVVIDYNITAIPEAMFDGCKSFVGSIPESVKSIGAFAYRGTALSSIDLSNVDTVGDYSFADAKNLKDILLTEGSQIEFGKGVFFQDTGLEILPEFDSDITNVLFGHTVGSKKEYFINSKYIGSGAYANNTGMDSVFLGSNVSYIGEHAFRNNSSLSLVDVQPHVNQTIDVHEDAFSGLENEEGRYDILLNVAEGTEETWKSHPVWTLFKVGHYVVGVEDAVADANVDIKVNRNGNRVDVSSSHNIDYIGIFSLNGMKLHESKPGGTAFAIDDLADSEIIIVKVVTGGKTKISKLK